MQSLLPAPSVKSMSQAFFVEDDPYKILGLGTEATEDDIKREYKQLSLQVHPDKNPDDVSANENFQSLSKAYRQLMDPSFREQYQWVVKKLPSISAALQTYSDRPQPNAFIAVYTAVYDILKAKMNEDSKLLWSQNLEHFLDSEITRSIGHLADCLREKPCAPHVAWMRRAVTRIYNIRNHLYCLQAAYAFAGPTDLELRFQKALTDARQEACINELADNFWCTIIGLVNVDCECSSVLRELIAVWCRCGCPVSALRVMHLPDDHRVYDAVRAGFALSYAKLLSPSMLSLDRSFNETCLFHVRNKSFMTRMADFLSDEDLQQTFGLCRGIKSLSK